MPEVTHHGRRTGYRILDGETDERLLCIHGSGGASDVWSGLAETPLDAVAADLSGHGRSADVDTSAGPATLAAYAEDVLAVARETDATVLVGHSLGGAVALHVVLETALDPDALVLVGTGAKLAVHQDIRTALAEDFEGAIEGLHAPDLLFHDPRPDDIEHSTALMRATGQSVTRRDFLTCHSFDVRDRLGEVTQPTLAITGEHDGLTPPAYHEYLAEHVGDGRVETIPDAAHYSMVERPTAFADAVVEFLDGL